MLILMGYLLSIYLIFKGIEIYQIGLTSQRVGKAHKIIGWLSLLACTVIGVFFLYLFTESGNQVTSGLDSIYNQFGL